MNRLLVLLLSILFVGCISGQTADRGELVVCGWDEVFIVDLNQCAAKDSLPQKIWSWRAAERTDLPDDFRGLFDTTDDCKPFDKGNKILITSSGGAVALVDRKKDRIIFYGRATNAHSADLLPNNRVAVAVSYSKDSTGNRLILFDMDKPDQEILSKPLYGGHGVVWDKQRQLLWALSDYDIRAYQLRDWDSSTPELKLVSTIALPDSGGHDFFPLFDSSLMFVTTRLHCWVFDRDSHQFTLHPVLGNFKKVKCVCQHPLTGQLVYVQAEGKDWWAERIRFLEPEMVLYEEGEHFYKVRWNIVVGD